MSISKRSATSRRRSEKALLIANGFSIDYDPQTFGYSSLLSTAAISHRLRDVFRALRTKDFEVVMRRLEQTRLLMDHYRVSKKTQKELRVDSDLLKSALIAAVAAHHPSRWVEVPLDRSRRCASFLRGFSSVFTLNYDLLLYWVVERHLRSVFYDGFDAEGFSQAEPSENPNLFYLHGALHLYVDASGQLKKLKTGLSSTSTIEGQLSRRLKSGRTPLCISGGTSKQKLRDIRDNHYLSVAYEALERNQRPLLVYGFRFHYADRHIESAISRSLTPEITATYHLPNERPRILGRLELLKQKLEERNGRSVNVSVVHSSEVFSWYC